MFKFLKSKSLRRRFAWYYDSMDMKFWQRMFYFVDELVVWPVTSRLYRIQNRLSRSWDHAKFSWSNCDFDMACVWDLFEFKLKRLLRCLEKANSVQEPQDLKALTNLIKIIKRQSNNDYSRKYIREHDKKWGKTQCRMTPNRDKNGKVISHTWHSWRNKCPEDASKELKEQERSDYMECYSKGEQDRVKDIRLMGDILVKHGLVWWD